MPRDVWFARGIRQFLLLLWGGLAVGGALPASGPARAEDIARRQAALDNSFRAQMESLAAKCDDLNLSEQAELSRSWFAGRDPQRHFLFLPPLQRAKPQTDAPRLVRLWHDKFREYRDQRAEDLFALAKELARSEREAEAYRLLHEVLHENPDQAEARRILGYHRSGDGWRRPFRRPRPRPARAAHPLFGWQRGEYQRVESEHFQVTTDVSARKGMEAADYLERVHAVWQQLFYEYWTVPGRLADRFAGGDRSLGPRRKFQVVLFRDRDEYVRQLTRFEPQIAVSVGYYAHRQKTAHFFAGDTTARSAWAHEATHQFFQESGMAVSQVGERSDFWVVEGIALYMESMVDRGRYVTTGGADADRLQFARYRALGEKFYVPLEKLVGYGRAALQRDQDIRRLYSQSAGLAHYLMHGSSGQTMQPFVRYLTAVYQGLASTKPLNQQMGMSYAQLDERYHQFLNVTDEDLTYVNRTCRNLCLGHTAVTDAGLEQLRECTELRWLDLSFTTIGNAGLAQVAAAGKLDQLNLEATRISDQAMKTISRFPELEELDLSQTAVGDDSLRTIANLKKLKILWLTGTRVTDQGLPALAELSNLEQLDVEGTAVTPRALDRLKERLPRLK